MATVDNAASPAKDIRGTACLSPIDTGTVADSQLNIVGAMPSAFRIQNRQFSYQPSSGACSSMPKGVRDPFVHGSKL